MAQYKAAYPADLKIHPEVDAFFIRFYGISDTPGLTNEDQMVSLHSAVETAHSEDPTTNGAPEREEITTLREGMWSTVASRKHTIHKIFPFGNDATEVMIYGSVELGLRSGSTVYSEWAARAQLTKDEADGEWKMSFYQVYMDTGPMIAQKK
ncbi:hypothetical protein AK830_g8904 [Neonectria ditissima]|uniref:SnoaL-like domain-containing protein n=1 Tax=Neonectria ditissima TaxID=78410 RepID=A0A0P7BDB8_9HYPO|nr:hypothetical protein AK830_g8904 [Neonectria ditissima]